MLVEDLKRYVNALEEAIRLLGSWNSTCQDLLELQEALKTGLEFFETFPGLEESLIKAAGREIKKKRKK